MAREDIVKVSSLKKRIFNAVIIIILLILLVVTAVNYKLYSDSITNYYSDKVTQLAETTAVSLDAEKVKALTDAVSEIYEGSGPRDPQNDLYRDIRDMDEYKYVTEFTDRIRDIQKVTYITIATIDFEHNNFVYIADADVTGDNDIIKNYPGDVAPLTDEEAETFSKYDDRIDMYFSSHNPANEKSTLCCAGHAIKDADGNVIAFAVIDYELGRIESIIISYSISSAILYAIVALIIALVTVLISNVFLIKPIKQLSEAGVNYYKFRKANRGQQSYFFEDYFDHCNVKRGGREIYQLSYAMVDLEHNLNQYMSNLLDVTKDRERIKTELSVATQIQTDMLPSVFPPFPDRDDIDLFALMEPAREVGGDFYDLFLIDDDHLALVVADVSGKGVPAALFMMISKILINNAARKEKSPAEALTLVNNQLCENNKEQMFVTAWLGIIDLKTGEMTYANAGHENPLVRKDGKWQFIRDPHGLVLAAMENMKYRNYTLKLEPGDWVFQYTDGVTEATDSTHQLFGEDRLLAAAERSSAEDTRTLLEDIRKDIEGFVGGASQFDDITMLGFRFQ